MDSHIMVLKINRIVNMYMCVSLLLYMEMLQKLIEL